MAAARLDQFLQPPGLEFKHLPAESTGKFRSSQAVFWIYAIIEAAAVVEESKQPDHLQIGPGLAAEKYSVTLHPLPVVWGMRRRRPMQWKL